MTELIGKLKIQVDILSELLALPEARESQTPEFKMMLKQWKTIAELWSPDPPQPAGDETQVSSPAPPSSLSDELARSGNLYHASHQNPMQQGNACESCRKPILKHEPQGHMTFCPSCWQLVIQFLAILDMQRDEKASGQQLELYREIFEQIRALMQETTAQAENWRR